MATAVPRLGRLLQAAAPDPPDARAHDGAERAPPPATEQGPSWDMGAVEALPRLLKIVGGIVAPTTLLTGLLFHFGRMHSAGYYRWFRINFTALDLTTNDFLFSGVDGLFVPVAVTGLLVLVLIWLHRSVARRLSPAGRRAAVRVLVPLAGQVGAVLVGVALLDLLRGGSIFRVNSPAGGICLAVGVLALLYVVRLLRVPPSGRGVAPRRRPEAALAEWGAGFLLVSVGLFWAVGGYAFGVGTGRAMALQRALPSVPEAVLYSERSLSLGVPGVTEQACHDPDAAYRFRYTGLRLVRQAGNQYVLLPATWDQASGTALLIPRSSSIRLEFSPAGQPTPGC
ncbi:hypothetical protein [Geodermatophilus sp. URMC 64]